MWLIFCLFNVFYIGLMIIAITAPVTKLKEQTAEDIAELEAEGDRIVSFNLEVNICRKSKLKLMRAIITSILDLRLVKKTVSTD